jgi:hypothetical protein
MTPETKGAEMAMLFRVENPFTKAGLWYSETGKYTGIVTKMENYRNKDLPMAHEDCMAGGWHSAVDNLDDLKQWFNFEEMTELERTGYGIYAFNVDSYRIGRSETGIEHAVFQRDAVVGGKYLRLDRGVLL